MRWREEVQEGREERGEKEEGGRRKRRVVVRGGAFRSVEFRRWGERWESDSLIESGKR